MVARKKAVVRTIERLALSGKWVEIWFKDGALPNHTSFASDYHHAVKRGYLLGMIPEDQYIQYMNHGLINWRVGLEFEAPNWEIVSVLPPKESTVKSSS